MSIRVMSDVWEKSQHSGTELLMLLAIADNANDERRAWPSVRTLARKTRMKPRNAQYLLKRLEESGELSINVGAGPNGSNVYSVKQYDLGGVQSLAGVQSTAPSKIASKGMQHDAPGGCNPASKGVQPTAPDPSLTVIEPSENLNAALPREPRPADLHFEALADLTGLTPPFRDWKKLTKTSAGQLNRYAKELRDVDATPEQIAGFKMWFSKNDWRGREGQAPTPADVVKLWSQYLNGANPNGARNRNSQPTPEHQARLQRIADEINRRSAERKAEARASGRS